MAQIDLPDELMRRLAEIAQRENRPVEDVIQQMVSQYELPDEESALGDLRRKLYDSARAYWRETGDSERVTLTDSQLDEQFWLFDQDGIPRLKSDQGKVTVQPNRLLALVGMFDIGPTDFAGEIDSMREEYHRDKFGDDR